MVVASPSGDAVLSPDEAVRILDVIAALSRYGAARGGRLPADIRRLAAELGSVSGWADIDEPPVSDPWEHELIGTVEAAGLLGCSSRHVRRLASGGVLTHVRRGGRLWVHRGEVEARAAAVSERGYRNCS